MEVILKGLFFFLFLLSDVPPVEEIWQAKVEEMTTADCTYFSDSCVFFHPSSSSSSPQLLRAGGFRWCVRRHHHPHNYLCSGRVSDQPDSSQPVRISALCCCWKHCSHLGPQQVHLLMILSVNTLLYSLIYSSSYCLKTLWVIHASFIYALFTAHSLNSFRHGCGCIHLLHVNKPASWLAFDRRASKRLTRDLKRRQKKSSAEDMKRDHEHVFYQESFLGSCGSISLSSVFMLLEGNY